MKKEPPLITSKQIAHHLGVHPRTVMRWVAVGRLNLRKRGSGGRTSPYESSREDLAPFKNKKEH